MGGISKAKLDAMDKVVNRAKAVGRMVRNPLTHSFTHTHTQIISFFSERSRLSGVRPQSHVTRVVVVGWCQNSGQLVQDRRRRQRDHGRRRQHQGGQNLRRRGQLFVMSLGVEWWWWLVLRVFTASSVSLIYFLFSWPLFSYSVLFYFLLRPVVIIFD